MHTCSCRTKQNVLRPKPHEWCMESMDQCGGAQAGTSFEERCVSDY